MKILIVGDTISAAYIRLFRDVVANRKKDGEVAEISQLWVGQNIIDEVMEAELIVFTGGGDINPTLYNSIPILTTCGISDKRDFFEMAVARAAIDSRVPTVGICRGAQLLCVANEGSLIQNVNKHRVGHPIVTTSGDKFMVTSTHHQMMVPEGDYELLARASESDVYDGLPPSYVRDLERRREKDPEVVWWSEVNSLAVQYHPEYMSTSDKAYQYFVELMVELLDETD